MGADDDATGAIEYRLLDAAGVLLVSEVAIDTAATPAGACPT